MPSSATSSRETEAPNAVDRADIQCALAVGAIMVMVKLAELRIPAWEMSRHTTDIVASLLTVAYILARARRNPAKLDAWGITAPLSREALIWAAAMLAAAVAVLAAGGRLAGGPLPFSPAYLVQMVEYIPAAFPQQFFMCSVGLALLAAWPPLRGGWRLPLAAGILFSLAHFWTPALVPGTRIPIQMMLFLPGFLAAYYFLRFRSILPLTAIHAIVYPLLHHWIEMRL